MSRRMDHVDADLAHAEPIAVSYRADAGLVGETILAVGTAFGRDVECGPRLPRKGPCAADEVLMNVCFRHGADAQSVLRGSIHVLVDAAVGIDDERVACCRAPHEETGLRQTRLEKMSEDHGVS